MVNFEITSQAKYAVGYC